LGQFPKCGHDNWVIGYQYRKSFAKDALNNGFAQKVGEAE
jgi:hypothetical protein